MIQRTGPRLIALMKPRNGHEQGAGGWSRPDREIFLSMVRRRGAGPGAGSVRPEASASAAARSTAHPRPTRSERRTDRARAPKACAAHGARPQKTMRGEADESTVCAASGGHRLGAETPIMAGRSVIIAMASWVSAIGTRVQCLAEFDREMTAGTPRAGRRVEARSIL